MSVPLLLKLKCVGRPERCDATCGIFVEQSVQGVSILLRHSFSSIVKVTRGIVFLDVVQDLIRVVGILKSDGDPIKWPFCYDLFAWPDLLKCEHSGVITDTSIDVELLGSIVVSHCWWTKSCAD
jgi:hypothetical protein